MYILMLWKPISTRFSIYFFIFLDDTMLLLLVNANVIHHVKNVEHSSKGAHGEVYIFHITVNSAHFFDQGQVCFFFTHCIVV